MDLNIAEIVAVEDVANTQLVKQMVELTNLQLAYAGGGIGNVDLA